MSAKNAVLERTGSHHVSDEGSHPVDGISREEVYGYFSASWRGQPVQVTVQADRYAHSSGISDWRVYASEARFEDLERNGGRGEPTTGTARAALSKLCAPMMTDWLASDAYTVSFQRAIGDLVMRHFRNDYSAARRVSDALVTFADHLTPAAHAAISETLSAYNAYTALSAHAAEVIKGEQPTQPVPPPFAI